MQKNLSVLIFQKILDQHPEHPRVLSALGMVEEQQGRQQQAKAYFERALKASPDDLIALNGLGMAYSQSGQYIEALTYFDKALALLKKQHGLHPGKPLLEYAVMCNNKGTVLAKLGETEKARHAFQDAILHTPENSAYDLPHKNLQKMEQGDVN